MADPEVQPRLIYHVALERDWIDARSAGEYRVSTRGATLDEVGYVHASFAHQVPGVGHRDLRTGDGHARRSCHRHFAVGQSGEGREPERWDRTVSASTAPCPRVPSSTFSRSGSTAPSLSRKACHRDRDRPSVSSPDRRPPRWLARSDGPSVLEDRGGDGRPSRRGRRRARLPPGAAVSRRESPRPAPPPCGSGNIGSAVPWITNVGTVIEDRGSRWSIVVRDACRDSAGRRRCGRARRRGGRARAMPSSSNGRASR